MKITTATFIKGIVGDDPILYDGKPQVVFIGRSNVGKSSLVNAFTKNGALARVSNTPGRTQQINMFLINNSWYLMDIPGYGFARVGKDRKEEIQELIDWYLFESECAIKRVVMIIDANVGPTKDDMEMFTALQDNQKNIVVVANKIDKIKKSELEAKIAAIRKTFSGTPVFPCAIIKNIGVAEFGHEIIFN